MKYREYQNFDEKKAALETIFEQWPPPFEPIWAVQVSQGRCGSNALWSIVKSFFKAVIGEPVFEKMDHEKQILRTNREKKWIPEPGKKYLYYNVHGVDPHRIHFPIFFWLLQNSPKIVHLTREDHLMRGISIYYHGYRANSEPIDISELSVCIKKSILQIEVVKSLISEFVSPDRLLCLSHYNLYYADTLQTLRGCIRFLECDPQQNHVTIPLRKRIQSHLIPNRQEVMDRYKRDLTEHAYWVPNDLNMEPIHNQIQETVAALIQLNVVDSPQRT